MAFLTKTMADIDNADDRNQIIACTVDQKNGKIGVVVRLADGTVEAWKVTP